MDPTFPLLQPPRQPLFDPSAFDRAIQAHGLVVEVHKALRCPGGMVSRYEQRRPHEDHLGCSFGFIYRLAGTCEALFTGNSKQQRSTDGGLVANSSGNITFERFYTSGPSAGKPVRVCQFDRLYLPDASVLAETWQLVDHNANGVDRLQYPAEEIGDLVTASGAEPKGFILQQGRIVWQGTDRPQVGPDGRGEVYVVRYLYRPFWYVSYQNHDLRFFTVQSGDGVKATAVHQSVSVQREYLFETEDNDPEAKPSRRQVEGPVDPPEYGPR